MNPLLFFAEDWGRHNSSCQRIAHELLQRDQRILWVNTVGTRRPGVNRYTVRRGLTKLNQWCLRSHRQPANGKLTVLAPLMWPSMHFSVERRVNTFLLDRQLRKRLSDLPSPPVVVAKVPLVWSLCDRLPAQRWVYYCVDNISAWPGSDSAALAETEARFVERADRIIVASDELQQRMQQLGRDATVLTHGVDLEFWGAPTTSFRLPPYPRPLIVFWGLVDSRIDPAIVERVRSELKEGTILFVGPRQSPPRGLFDSPGVQHHPSIDYADLPAVAEAADVLIGPYRRCAATRCMQPIKLMEYMATSKPVVVTDLPAMGRWRDCVFVAEDERAFSSLVTESLRTGLPSSQRDARTRLKNETWGAKASQFVDLVLNP